MLVPLVFISSRCSVGSPGVLLLGFSGFLPLEAPMHGNSIFSPLYSIIGIPVPLEIEKKFLIEMPNIEVLKEKVSISESNIDITKGNGRDNIIGGLVGEVGVNNSLHNIYLDTNINTNNAINILYNIGFSYLLSYNKAIKTRKKTIKQ